MAESDDGTELVEEARRLVAGAQRITVLTGAGISTDSGIPDFRGPQGVWTKNPEAEKQATLDHYMSDPVVRARSWQSRLRHGAFTAEPNRGHIALVDLERQGRLHTLITQNVDGLHQKAGSSPERVVEIHGTVHQVTCMACDERAPMQRALDRVRAGEADPACRTCGGILKSATISFGQSLDLDALERAEVAARECDLMLAVGTTLTVHPIAGVVPVAASAGASVVIVNAEETAYDHLAAAVIRAPIGDVLPLIVEPP
ncbi:MAG: NAD-dependent deacetylase [Acidimicrobiia bacterium]|nr:NAD-dependent deacetylase [Acidimicrobiia bacterium]